MPFDLKDLTHGFLLPAVAAAAVFLLLRTALPFHAARRLPSPLALVTGFLVGYWLLELGPVKPKSARDWLPAMVVLATAGTLTPWRSLKVRGAIVLVVAALSAWLLVPNWGRLETTERAFVMAWHVMLVPMILCLEPLEERLTDWAFPAALTGVAACAAIILLLCGSLRFCQTAGCGTGALAGMSLVCFSGRRQTVLSGIVLPYTILLSGILLIGRIGSFSEVPWFCYVLPPLAPLALWIAAVRPLSQLTAAKAAALRIGLPLAVCAAAVVPAVIAWMGTTTE
ncbi:MAG: hypothetical protein R3C19_09380 [Planctomycetaceae bacterium]